MGADLISAPTVLPEHATARPGAPRALADWLGWLICGYFWFHLVNHLRITWSVNEQYSFGWAVPALCLFLLLNRMQMGRNSELVLQKTNINGSRRLLMGMSLLLLLAAFVFIRFIEEANPDWRLVSWAMAIGVIGFSLVMIDAMGGRTRLKQCAFSLAFFLVAVPWPTLVEHTTISWLTRGIVATTVEFLGLSGMPAIQHGNIIETTGGLVDVDEACSGIRSLQAALMLALFFGELRRLSMGRRILLGAIALGLACIFNLVRTVLLSTQAAWHGSAGVMRWHDPAGLVILVGCFIGVWVAARMLSHSSGQRERVSATARAESSEAMGSTMPGARGSSHASPLALALACLAFLVAGEVAVRVWYAAAPAKPAVRWTAALPKENPSYKAVELSPAMRRTLRFNEGDAGAWRNEDGTTWQMFYFRWNPGRASVYLARNHTPEFCLPAAGKTLHGISDLSVEAGGVTLPFRCYTTGEPDRVGYVFYSLWEDGAVDQRVASSGMDWKARMEAVRQRRRNPGQRVIEVAIGGASNQAQAERSLREGLSHMLRN